MSAATTSWGASARLDAANGRADLIRVDEGDEHSGPMTLYLSGSATPGAGASGDVLIIARVEWSDGKAGHSRDYFVGYVKRQVDQTGAALNPQPKLSVGPIRVPLACARASVTVRIEKAAGGAADADVTADVSATISHGTTGEERDTSIWIPPKTGGGNGQIFPRGGKLIRVQGFNDGGADVYVQIFDKAAAPVTGDAPLASFKATAGQNFSDDRWPNGRTYLRGMWWAASDARDAFNAAAGALVVLEAEIEAA